MASTLPPGMTRSADAVTLEAASDGALRGATRGRLLAQLEHNAMLALGLVRAGSAALQGAARSAEHASRLLGHSHGPIDLLLARELRGAFDELSQQVQLAAHDGHPLLQGGSIAFALEDPWIESSAPLPIELPDLTSLVIGEGGLDDIELGSARATAAVLQCLSELRIAIQAGHSALQRALRQLHQVLLRLHGDRSQRGEDNVEQLAQLMCSHLLRSGASALRVQGTPSSRAASLVEGSEEHV